MASYKRKLPPQMKYFLYLIITCTIAFSACKKEQIPQQNIGINGAFYNTSIIGGKSWTTVNYNGPGGVDVPGANAGNGKVYSIAEASAIVLPKGWHIPTVDDFYDLLTTTGAGDQRKGYIGIAESQLLSLMSTTGWIGDNGTNTTGFNAFPAGYYIQTTNGLVWQEQKQLAVFLTTTSTTGNLYAVFTLGVNAGALSRPADRTYLKRQMIVARSGL
jgi:uncharacterized protein (TIGR02145 family)